MICFTSVRWTCVVLTLLSMAIVGCGGRVDDTTRFGKTGKVSGTLKYVGNPVKDARVQFSSSENGVSVIGIVKDSAFAIADPVPVGTYKVVVLTPQEPPPTDGAAYQPKDYPEIPLKYRDEFNSDLTATVKEGENKFEFEMKP